MSKAPKPWEHAKAGGSEHDELAARFVESLSYDTRLYKHDIAGSIAHARMLQKVGLLTAQELVAIERGLTEIEQEIEAAGVSGWRGWKIELEDVHMCVEAALIEKIGDPGRKLHTGRSRNDQVAIDLKLWITEASHTLSRDFEKLFAAFVELAERDGEIVMPSYTHLQRAQPIVAGGEIVAWLTAFDRCLTRLMMLNVTDSGNPLGSGAIGGSSLPLDRFHTAEALHVGEPMPSSIDATASRDDAADFVYALAMTAMTLSRWAEQWIIYMTSEFGFLKIGEAFTTGSSMMPQKRNPDMLELIRGRCGTVYGHLVSLLTILKGLPIGYNRDLQEDKRHVFAAYDMVRDCLRMAEGVVKTAKFQAERIAKDIDRGFADATMLAEYLVNKGVPFRTAHQHVGVLVRLCEQKGGAKLSDLSIADMRTVSPQVGDDVKQWLGAANVVHRYQSYGNAGTTGYKQQLEAWCDRLGKRQCDNGNGNGGGAVNLFGVEDIGVHAADEQLIAAYQHAGRTLDDLPYTQEFETLFNDASHGRSRHEVFHRLHNLRKAGKLPKAGRATEKPPIITAEAEQTLAKLVTEKLGKLSLRDNLPYTPAMDEIVATFDAHTGLSLSPHQVWRVIAKLAK
jgi:argininosuccinate lyase